MAIRIDRGHYGDVPLEGLCFAEAVHWPGRMDEGNGVLQPYIDERAGERQREALLSILAGKERDLFFEIVAAVCPDVQPPIFAPIEFEFDMERLTARAIVGDGLFHLETAGIPSFNSAEPHRVRVVIRGGFEYTGDGECAETATTTTLRSKGAVAYDHQGTHANLAYVKHRN